jgi:hypothetical protein
MKGGVNDLSGRPLTQLSQLLLEIVRLKYSKDVALEISIAQPWWIHLKRLPN